MKTGRIQAAFGFALLVLLVVASRPQAAQFSTDVTFSTANQSMWSPGVPLVDLTRTEFFGPEWDGRSFAVWGSLPTVTGFAAAHLHPGRIGLEASIQVSTGGVAVDYPVQLDFLYPDKVNAGESFALQTSFVRRPNPKLDITGFGAEISVDAVADVLVTWGGGYDISDVFGDAVYTADHGGPTSMSFYGEPLGVTPADDGIDTDDYYDDLTVISSGGEQRVNLISIGSGTGVDFEIPGFDVAGISAQVPEPLNQSTMAYKPNGNLQTAATGDPFLTLDLDVVKIASLIAQAFSGGLIPPLSGEIEFESFSTTISYTLLDIALSAGPALHQDFEFVFNGLNVALTTSDGQVIPPGKIGDTFNLVAPTGGTDLDISALVSIDQQFINKTGLALQLALSLEALSADVTLFDIDLAAFGPLYEDSASVDSPPVFLLTPDPFALQGFNTETVELTVNVVPEPATLFSAMAFAGGCMMPRNRRK
jgi:hypothetical protein